MRRILCLLLVLLIVPVMAQAATETYDAIVVGSGAGGLGAAAQLTKAGKKVLLLEQHDKFGGYMTAFERGDYRFEVSLHELDGVAPGNAHYQLFQDAGVLDKVKLHRLDPLYRATFPGFSLDVPADVNLYRQRMIEKFPAERAGINKLFKKMLSFKKQLDSTGGMFSKNPLRRAWAYFTSPLLRPDLMTYLDKTLDKLVYQYIEDPQARGVFCQLWGYLGLPPEQLSAMYFAGMWGSYHTVGGYYPEGGSQAISDALAQYVAAHGGTVKTDSRVAQILVADGRVSGVRLDSGEQYFAPYVVSNASLPTTVEKLVGAEHFPPEYVAKISKLEVSLSLAQIFIGIKDRSVLEPLGGNHSVFVNEDFSALVNAGYAVDGDLEKCPFVLVDYGIHDPTCAPKGGSVLVITVPLQYDYLNRWRRDEGYDAYTKVKNEMAEAILTRAETILPGLRGQIAVMEIGTPLTMERYTLNPRGAVYGYAHTPKQSIIFRPKNKSPLPGLYYAGAWTFMGGGQSACLQSGMIAAEQILAEQEQE